MRVRARVNRFVGAPLAAPSDTYISCVRAPVKLGKPARRATLEITRREMDR